MKCSSLAAVFPAMTPVLLLLSAVRLATAQPLSASSTSPEWEAANSSLVIRGVIEGVKEHELKGGLYPDARIHRYQTVTVRVLETLKGEPAERVRFVHDGDIGPERLAELIAAERELLMFFEPWIRSEKFNRQQGGYAYSRSPLVLRRLAVLEPGNLRWAQSSIPMLSSSLENLTTTKQVTRVIEEYLRARNDRGRVLGRTMSLPAELKGPFIAVHFTYPADAVEGFDRPTAGPVLEFEKFKKAYQKPLPPPEKLTSYDRKGGGYVGVESLELMAMDCDVIVRAVVDDFCFLGDEDDPATYGFGVKMGVREVLKGACPDTIGVYMAYPRVLERLRDRRQEVLLFLRNWGLGGLQAQLGFATRGDTWDDAVIVLDKKEAEVLFSDLTWHRDPDEILERARDVIRREEERTRVSGVDPASPYAHYGTRPPVYQFHPPASIRAGSDIADNVYSKVFIPVGPELEAMAREWVRSDDKDRRLVGARALVYFKSDKNVELLKSLLGDDAQWGRRDALYLLDHLAHPFDPRYLIRWEAWHTLAGWGYGARRPAF